MLTDERLNVLMERMRESRVAIVGDFFLDKYLDVDPQRVETSVETGLDAHQVVQVHTSAGAAGTVVNNIASLGATSIEAVGVIGDDGNGWELRQCLEKLDCRTDLLMKREHWLTPTYLKPHDVGRPGLAGEHSRYDTKNRSRLPDVKPLLSALEKVWRRVDAVIVMDQIEEDEGAIIGSPVRRWLSRKAGQGSAPWVWVDSRFHAFDFAHVVVKPNQFEACRRRFPEPGEQVDRSEVIEGVAQLRGRTGRPVICTLGDAGVLVHDDDPLTIPALKVNGPVDATGAGDSFTAGAVLARCAGASWAEAAHMGILVSSLTVTQLDTTGTARIEQLPPQLALWYQQQ